MKTGDIYYYQEFSNEKLLNIVKIKLVSKSDDVYRFQAIDETCATHYNIHRDCYPMHAWYIDKNIKHTRIIEAK